ncbi:hypothetical protein [Paraburkholderia caledonica]|uniref:Uncharacterized protein n=1 Tax=Paraburkholderia caledonica TaxID=134536 RepID=A0ABU1KT75_9BURK|nr:hypothetical protein [Paraburkholderia caledonica]MDR6374167.1 hypothetical protein [Paraburkholderia caledonica]
MDKETVSRVKARFLKELVHHLEGWRAKVRNDFSKENFDNELKSLKGDELYPKFHLATADYVNVRFMGRISISIGRRLGEIYDKVPRFLVGARFGLDPASVAPLIDGLELDICLPFKRLAPADHEYVLEELTKLFPQQDFSEFDGVGIEIRYNFNPNDSARLRKDVAMAEKLMGLRLFPVYLIFSSISPRDEAIKRLSNANWRFVVGRHASELSANLFGLDLSTILDLPEVSTSIKVEIDAMMSDLKRSYAFQQFVESDYSLQQKQALSQSLENAVER